jgi:hypothetical protein
MNKTSATCIQLIGDNAYTLIVPTNYPMKHKHI